MTVYDIINNKSLEAEQLQKYYHLGQLYQNKPASYYRQLKALKYELETNCGTRTVNFHLRIANRVKKIFDKKGFNRLLCNIDISPSSIGRLKEEELEKILEQIWSSLELSLLKGEINVTVVTINSLIP